MKYIFKKLFIYIAILFFVETLIFVMFEIVPGNPVLSRLGINVGANEMLLANMTEEYNLNGNVFIKYINWIKDVFTLNFGTSYIYTGYDVFELILPRLFVTIKLAFLTLIVSVIIGVFISTLMIINKNSKFTKIIENINVIGLSMPSFWVGIVLITIFGNLLGIMPVSNGSLVGPVICLSVPSTALVIRHLYANFKSEIKKEYVTYGRIKGLSELEIVLKHVFKNSLVPFFSVILIIFLSILTGSVMVENIFSLNGIGRFMVSSIKDNDYPLIGGLVFCYVIIILSVSWIIDIISVLVDKRIYKK